MARVIETSSSSGSTTLPIFERLISEEQWLLALPLLKELRPQLSPATLLQRRSQVQEQGYELFGLVERSELIVVAGIAWHPHIERGQELWVHDLVTKRAKRRQGYATEMQKHLESYAIACGAKRILLHSRLERNDAHRLYEQRLSYKRYALVFACELEANSPGYLCATLQHNSNGYFETVALRQDILRSPLGLSFSPAELEDESDSLHLACYAGQELMGCLILKPDKDNCLKMRQLAVASKAQAQGVGRLLVDYSENVAKRHGAKEIVLHARETAVGFYEKLGYRSEGNPFIEVTVPHLLMRKALT